MLNTDLMYIFVPVLNIDTSNLIIIALSVCLFYCNPTCTILRVQSYVYNPTCTMFMLPSNHNNNYQY